jgi:hypothetical protein
MDGSSKTGIKKLTICRYCPNLDHILHGVQIGLAGQSGVSEFNAVAAIGLSRHFSTEIAVLRMPTDIMQALDFTNLA